MFSIVLRSFVILIFAFTLTFLRVLVLNDLLPFVVQGSLSDATFAADSGGGDHWQRVDRLTLVKPQFDEMVLKNGMTSFVTENSWNFIVSRPTRFAFDDQLQSLLASYTLVGLLLCWIVSQTKSRSVCRAALVGAAIGWISASTSTTTVAIWWKDCCHPYWVAQSALLTFGFAFFAIVLKKIENCDQLKRKSLQARK